MILENEEFTKKIIVDQLYWDSRVNAADVKVEVKGTNVTLTGNTPDYIARGAATEIAMETEGVSGVTNHIAVIPENEIDDGTILRNVKHVLSWDSSLAEYSFDVAVSEGNVTVEGIVDSCWKKHKAEDLIGSLKGVKSVENRIVIAPSGDFIDQTLAEKIMEVLQRIFSVNFPDIQIAVADGVATLSGTIASRSEAKRAVSAVEHVRGVAGVQNELVITDIS